MADFQVGQLTIPIFVSTVINWVLLRALLVQICIYYLAFPKDHASAKLIVAFVLITEILQTLGDSRDTIHTLGAGFGNFEILDEIGWAWFSVPILGSTTIFAWRIFVVAKKWYIPVLIAIIATFQSGAGIWTGISIICAKRFSLLRDLKPSEAWPAAMAAHDRVIVAATMFYLFKGRDPGCSRRMEVTINRINRITVETGVICAVFAIVILYLFVAFDGNNYHLGVCIWLSKLYSNSILLILNSRAHIGHRGKTVNAAAGLATVTSGTEVAFRTYSNPAIQAPGVSVTRTTHSRFDSSTTVKLQSPIATGRDSIEIESVQ